jgi:hypothetical protein
MPGSKARIILPYPSAAIGLVAIGLVQLVLLQLGLGVAAITSAQTGSILGRAVIPAVQQVEYYNKTVL